MELSDLFKFYYLQNLTFRTSLTLEEWNEFPGSPMDEASVRDEVSRSFLRCSPKFRKCQTVF